MTWVKTANRDERTEEIRRNVLTLPPGGPGVAQYATTDRAHAMR